jgi:hypothetical protein
LGTEAAYELFNDMAIAPSSDITPNMLTVIPLPIVTVPFAGVPLLNDSEEIFYSSEFWSASPYGWIDCPPTSISINRRLICFTKLFLSMHEPVCRHMGLKEHMTLAFDLVHEIYTVLFLQVSGQQILLILP